MIGRSDDELEYEAAQAREEGNITLDLTRLETLNGPESTMLTRYLMMIQMQRQDFNGRMLTIRRDDLRAIACILDTSVEMATGRLVDLGLRLSV